MARARYDELLKHDVDDQKVADLGFTPKLVDEVPEKVRSLTVRDLNDFARRMSGQPIENKVVLSLTVQEIKGIETIFGQYREQALDVLARTKVESLGTAAGLEISVSCCCCTPCCCCCAAVDVDPFEA